MKTSVGVVILDLNQKTITIRCLRSLARGSRVPDIVVLVENGTESVYDRYNELSTPLEIIRLHPGRNLGCAGGRNLGLSYLTKNSSVTTLVVLDNDTVVPHDFVEHLAGLTIPTLEVVAPVILDLRTRDVWSCGGRIAPDGSVEQLTSKRTQDHEEYAVDWAPGACLIMAHQTWEVVGEFDSWMNFLFEDIEWCLRVRKAGGRVVVHPDLRLLHEAHLSLNGRWSQARVRFWARNGTLLRLNSIRPRPVASARWLADEIALAARDLVRGRVSWSIARLRGLLEGLNESVRRRYWPCR